MSDTLERPLDRSEATARLALRALAGADLSQLLSEAASLLAEALDVEYAQVLELLPHGQAFVLRAGVGWQDGLVGKAVVSAGSESQAGYTLSVDQPVMVEDLPSEDRFSGPALLRDHGIVSGISVVIQGDVRPYGILGAHSRRPRRFTPPDAQFLQTVATLLAEAIRRWRSEEALRESGVFLQGLLNSLADVVFTVRLPERRIEYASRAIDSVFGIPPGEAVGQTTRVLYTDDEGFAGFGQMMSQALARGEPGLQTEWLFRRKNGEIFPAEISLTFIVEGGQPLRAVGVVHDLTRRKQAERALLESQRQIIDILENISEGFVAIDSNWRYVYRNSQADRMVKRRPGELLGKILWEEFPAAAELPFFELAHRVMADRQSRKFQEHYPGLDAWFEGTIYPYPGGISVFYRDVTDRKRAEESLRQHGERLKILHDMDRDILEARSLTAIAEVSVRRVRTLVPCLRASLAVFDAAANQAALLAVDVDRPTRLPAGARLPPESYGPREALRRGKTNVVGDVLSLSPRSEMLQTLEAEGVRSFINVPLISREELIGCLNLWSDRPDAFGQDQLLIAAEVADHLAVALQQARMREELERHAAELEARVAERTQELRQTNAELESFCYSVSHDLRAPLRAMQGFAQALLEDFGDRLEPAGREYADRVVSAARRMDLLIQDLLAYSRVSRSDLELSPVPLDSALREVLAQLHPAVAERQSRVEIEPLPSVLAHRATLVQVLANLIANAIKFVEPGVTPRVRIHAERRGAQTRLWVEDNGIGIRRDHQERVFRVFERLHGEETYPGTGIGLAIVRKGMERMGGRVGVISDAGQGSRFWIELPTGEGGDSSGAADGAFGGGRHERRVPHPESLP